MTQIQQNNSYGMMQGQQQQQQPQQHPIQNYIKENDV